MQTYSVENEVLQVDITSYPAGLYLIKVSNNKTSFICKVIKNDAGRIDVWDIRKA